MRTPTWKIGEGITNGAFFVRTCLESTRLACHFAPASAHPCLESRRLACHSAPASTHACCEGRRLQCASTVLHVDVAPSTASTTWGLVVLTGRYGSADVSARFVKSTASATWGLVVLTGLCGSADVSALVKIGTSLCKWALCAR